MRDGFSGYLRAPGSSTYYYNQKPAYIMHYAGLGMVPEHYDKTDKTFLFLREALRLATPELPYRGPEYFANGEYQYRFKMIEGDIEDGLWKEEVTKSGIAVFRQTGLVGLVIHRTPDKQPLYPWNF